MSVTVEASQRRPRKKTKMEREEVCEVVDVEDYEFCSQSILAKGTNKSNAISVEQYNENRDLQLAIMASRLQSPHTKPNFIDLSRERFQFLDDQNDDDADIRVRWFNSPKTRKKPFTGPSVTENGQSSNSNNDPSFVCEICAEPKSGSESFSIKGCSHSYCSGCMARYVASKLQDNITRIDCPVSGCNGSLEPEYCRSILPPEVFDRWGTALCEALILGTEKFYCPYKDCSVMLIDDGKEVITNSECPSCYRMFCAQCKVPWHEGIECAEFQKLNKDEREKEDIMLKNLAQNKQWKRCPTCKYYVERSSGCLFIQCRCGTAFCYNCGNIFTNKSTHYCSKCKH
ncbi:E3 ubiquitin-protein ligase RSL1-like [Humulus lupulus]|uniref:E3 ubiquitin-protein ligase RSL1-like n=1 Tax=Humulus lupulus TaxID=3486 RepID=UPI002B411CE0|nr:E3 ubiquitin-protein ligase RSL1-like [Humulus lupulus]